MATWARPNRERQPSAWGNKCCGQALRLLRTARARDALWKFCTAGQHAMDDIDTLAPNDISLAQCTQCDWHTHSKDLPGRIYPRGLLGNDDARKREAVTASRYRFTFTVFKVKQCLLIMWTIHHSGCPFETCSPFVSPQLCFDACASRLGQQLPPISTRIWHPYRTRLGLGTRIDMGAPCRGGFLARRKYSCDGAGAVACGFTRQANTSCLCNSTDSWPRDIAAGDIVATTPHT